jgi:SRSO17 transposase
LTADVTLAPSSAWCPASTAPADARSIPQLHPRLRWTVLAMRRVNRAFVPLSRGLLGRSAMPTGQRGCAITALGCLMPGARKSVEPIAAVTAPARVPAQHQSLLHFVGNAPWSDERVLAKVHDLVLPSIERSRPIEAWIIDDTGFPKKGRHSVGVTRQYCGQLGKQDNCQVAVTLSIANRAASLPIAHRLYLPEDWAADPARRDKAGVPQQPDLRPSPRSRLARSVLLSRPAYRRALC